MSFEPHIFAKLREAYEFRHEPEQMHVLTEVFWRLLLVVAAVLVVFWIWFGIAQLVGVVTGSEIATGNSSDTGPLHTDALDATLQDLSTRQAHAQALVATPVVVSDPAVAK